MADKHPTSSEIGQQASARWAHPHDLSEVRAEGKIVAFCDAPQVLIETDAGERVWWRADLTLLDRRPCLGKNTNVCVAEGCYGEACITTPPAVATEDNGGGR